MVVAEEGFHLEEVVVGFEMKGWGGVGATVAGEVMGGEILTTGLNMEAEAVAVVCLQVVEVRLGTRGLITWDPVAAVEVALVSWRPLREASRLVFPLRPNIE